MPPYMCDYCCNIPQHPPPLHPNFGTMVHKPESHISYLDRRGLPPVPFGYHHHRSIRDLQFSSRTCSLCRGIFDEFQSAIDWFKHAVYARTNIRIRGADYGFYITQRPNLQDGFYVWIYGTTDNILLVGAFGYIVRNDNDPLARTIMGREILTMANDDYTKSIAQGWVRKCVNDHPLCGAPNLDGEKPPLPTRVLDLGRFGRKVVLLTTNGKRGDYCALSYSWGDKPHPFKLTHANKKDYASDKGIQFTGLRRIPQTIVDAIEITRMLGIRYLWVDALCIVQGDNDEFHREGAKMMDYYENSYVTIAAAASTSAYHGIFLPRDPPTFSFETLYTDARGVTGMMTAFSLNLDKERMQENYDAFEGENIITRAWTLQERILSTRSIVYASDQMYYECNENFLSENGYHVKGRRSSVNPMTTAIGPAGRAKQDMSQMWSNFVGTFTARGHGLYEPDINKFVAFGGLAKKYASLFGDEYIAGHWKKTLVKTLFWHLRVDIKYGSRPKWDITWPPTPYRAPSWSWAITDHEVTPARDSLFINAQMYAKLVDYQLMPINEDNVYGGIEYASIRLNAPFLPVEIKSSTHNRMQDFECYLSCGDGDLELVSRDGQTHLDCKFQRELDDIDTYALVLARIARPQAPVRLPIDYICLLVTDNGNDAYRRIGAARLSEDALGENAPNLLPRSSWVEVLLE